MESEVCLLGHIPRTRLMREWNLSGVTLWRLQVCGRLTPIHLGRRIFYSEREVAALLENRLHPAAPSIA